MDREIETVPPTTTARSSTLIKAEIFLRLNEEIPSIPPPLNAEIPQIPPIPPPLNAEIPQIPPIPPPLNAEIPPIPPPLNEEIPPIPPPLNAEIPRARINALINNSGGMGSLIKLLPTGTVFFYQILNPVVTNSGDCNNTYKILTSTLLVICGFSCFISTFTDSYTGTDNKRHYGIVTIKGLWPSPPELNMVDLSKYRLKFSDFVHAAYSLLIFALLGLLDTNTVQCFYPSFESTQKQLLWILPPAIGPLVGVVFWTFPLQRHGIGYPVSTDESHATAVSLQNPAHNV